MRLKTTHHGLLQLFGALLALLTLSALSSCGTADPETSMDAVTISTQSGGAPLTHLPWLSTAAVTGTMLEETERMPSPSSPQSDHRYLIDYSGQRMRFEGYVRGALRLLEVNEGGSTKSLSTFGPSIREHARSFDGYERSHDFLAGLPVTRESEMSVDERPADVYRVEFPDKGSEMTADYALIYVDRATGLRFREKWVSASEVVRVVSRRLVAATPEHEALLSRDSVQASSAGALDEALVPD
jgi:hypothetical protein